MNINQNNNIDNINISLQHKPKTEETQTIKINQEDKQIDIKDQSNINFIKNENEINILKTTNNEMNLTATETQFYLERKGDEIKANYIKEKVEISYEKNQFILTIDELGKEANQEKIKPNKYSLVNVDDPDLFDGKIKCVKTKCILFGILTALLNTFRLIYLIFLHLIYPLILWAVRFVCALLYCFFCCFDDDKVKIDQETKRERIDSNHKRCDKLVFICKNCGQAFINFICNFVKCPCWFYEFILDCLYDIKNRAMDNARNGCYRYIHYGCRCFEKKVENPFNDYMKKRNIILTTDPNDPSVIYSEACQNNIKI